MPSHWCQGAARQEERSWVAPGASLGLGDHPIQGDADVEPCSSHPRIIATSAALTANRGAVMLRGTFQRHGPRDFVHLPLTLAIIVTALRRRVSSPCVLPDA
jgi:hypothetical protein